MIYAYLRVSTDRQSVENQKFEILKYTDRKKLHVDTWIEETESGRTKSSSRKLGGLLNMMKEGDLLILSELSRLGRSLMEIMSILHDCMEKDIRIHSVKEDYELGNNINSKVLAFAFGLSAEIERNLISQRTKEALARKKSEGVRLGRPVGSLSSKTKLSGKEDEIKELLNKKVSFSAISRIFEVNRVTVKNFVISRNLLDNEN